MLSWEQIDPPDQVSADVPSLLCSHNDISLSLAAAIVEIRGYDVIKTKDAITENQNKSFSFLNIFHQFAPKLYIY